MKKIKNNVPNFITCCNLICGISAITQVLSGSIMIASFFILAGAVFDLSDGLIAKLLKAQSSIGEDLDSLADMVSFGVAPGIIIYKYLEESLVYKEYLPYVAFLIPLFSAIRLSVFNNDSEQSSYFKGLPTPANALFFSFFPFFDKINYSWSFFDYFLIIFVILLSFLMVSKIRMLSFKIKKPLKKEYLLLILLSVSAIFLFFLLKFAAIPIIIILYIILSLLNDLQVKKKNK